MRFPAGQSSTTAAFKRTLFGSTRCRLAREMSMRFVSILILIFTVACATPGVRAQTKRLPEPVAQALVRAKLPDSSVAVYVHEIGAERPLIAFGAERPLNPAS